MAKRLMCDLCKNETTEIAFKLYLSPIDPKGNRRHDHANYTAHADIGVCCQGRVQKIIDWTKRRPNARTTRRAA